MQVVEKQPLAKHTPIALGPSAIACCVTLLQIAALGLV
jgi:hypothetical protein